MRAIDNCSKSRPKRTAWYNLGFPYLEGELVQEFFLASQNGAPNNRNCRDDRFAVSFGVFHAGFGDFIFF